MIFLVQFANAKLRRCNLIAFDARAHGATVGKVPTDYRRAGAADDVFKFMVSFLNVEHRSST